MIPSLVVAYYKDKESSIVNTFAASTLDTTMTSSSHTSIELQKGSSVSFDFQLGNIGQLTTSNTERTTGITSNTLAGVIQVNVQINNGPIIYTNPLSSFNMVDFLDQVHGQNDTITYNFYISNTDYDSNPASSLTFNIQNNSWMQGQSSSTGFTDTEELFVTLYNPTPVPMNTFILAPLQDLKPEAGNTLGAEEDLIDLSNPLEEPLLIPEPPVQEPTELIDPTI